MNRATPESQGIPSAALTTLFTALNTGIDEVHSVMVARHGAIVAEGWWHPYGPNRSHLLYSLTKSFTATAIGLAAAEGRLKLDDAVVSFFPGVAPARPSRRLAKLTVRHLLTMATGRLTDSLMDCVTERSGDWVRGFFRRPWLKDPGSPWVYDTGASHVLGAIVAVATGQDLRTYLTPRLFEPLGFGTPVWETDPKGLYTGGFGLQLRTEDVLKFGQLYLQNGVWNGKRLLPEGWVAEATRQQIANDTLGAPGTLDWRQGYGYQFWCGRHGSFRGDGAFSQLCLVFPEQDTVVAVTAGTWRTQAVVDAVWDHLLPTLTAPLPTDPAAVHALTLQLADLKHLPAPGGRSPLEPRLNHRFVLEANPWGARSLSFAFSSEELVWTLTSPSGDRPLTAGRGRWVESLSSFLPPIIPDDPRGAPTVPLVSSFGWTGPATLTILVRPIEGPFVYTFTVWFAGKLLKVQGRVNVTMGTPNDLPTLVGVS